MTLNLSGETLRDSNPNPALTSSCECKIVASVQIKATWTHEDTNTQNDTNDPPPTSVWVVETSSASWGGLIAGMSGVGDNVVRRPGSGVRPADAPPPPNYTYSGSASDGLGDPEIKSPADGPPYISGSSVTSNPQNLAPPPTGWAKCAVANGQITLTMPRSLSADATASGKTPGQVGVSCGLGPYTITVHAQPYNFTQVSAKTGNNGAGGSDGTYITKYTWSSTNGSLSDLSSCTEYEVVTYPGTQGTATSPTAYLPLNPPFNSSWDYDTSVNPPQPHFPNPTQNGGNASAGFSTDTIAIYGFSPPYTTGGGFTGTQNFYFDDSQTGEKMVPMPGNVPMPISIVRNVGTLGPNYTPYWWYTVTKTTPTSNPVVKYPLPGQ